MRKLDQVWLRHFISCLFHALGTFHQTPCVHKKSQKQTIHPLVKFVKRSGHQMAKCCGLDGIYRGGALVAVGHANRD
jgi:hypothetical protein